MATTNISLGSDWKLISSGPTFIPVSIQSINRQIEIAITTTTPPSSFYGIQIHQDQAYHTTLCAGFNLYARYIGSGAAPCVVNDGGGIYTTAPYARDDFYLALAKGDIKGHTSQFKFSRSSTITVTESVVWDGATTFTWLQSEKQVTVVSGSADDTNITGIGAWTVALYGLDDNFEEISEIISMNGLTPVTSVNSYRRIYRALVVASGTDSATSDANKGIITISTVDATPVTMARILIGNGQTLMSPFTIPAGKTGYVTGANFSTGQGKQVLIKAKVRNALQSANGAFSVKYVVDIYENVFDPDFKVGYRIPEKTDLCFTASTTSGTVDASISYGIILVDN